MNRKDIELMKKATVFSSLSQQNLRKLASVFIEHKYPAGAHIFREGDVGESVMLIKSGIVKIIKRGSSGEDDVHLADRGPGEIFGEMALIENSPRFADAVAEGDVSVLTLTKSHFEQLLQENPAVVLEIMNTLSSKLRQADLQMIRDLERKNLELESANKKLHSLAEELKRSNSDLVRAKEFRDKIIDNAPFFMVITDSSGRVKIMNGSAENVFGRRSDDAEGKYISEIIRPADGEGIFDEINHSLAADGVWNGETMTGGTGGSTIVNLTAVKLAANGSELDATSALYMGQDITEAKHMQRQAFQLERMATRGEMAAEIAHELNNFLAIVSGNLELLVMDINRGRLEKIVKKTASMKDGIGRITKFVEGLMSVARPEANLEIFDVHQFIDNELFFLRPQPRFKDIEFTCRLGNDIPTVEVDRGQLQQVLFNILNNAADALSEIPPGKKRVTISTSYSKSDDMVILTIHDNGCGMSDENYGKVFRQHFTTKKTGHGFGLLAVKRVIKSHGGRISASKGPDGGACFRIELPRRLKQKEARALESKVQEV
jgi:PAS domain S-box-containing protein